MHAPKSVRVVLPYPPPAPRVKLPLEIARQKVPPGVTPPPVSPAPRAVPPVAVDTTPPPPVASPTRAVDTTPPPPVTPPATAPPRSTPRGDPTNTHTYDGTLRGVELLEGTNDEKKTVFEFLRSLVILVDGEKEALRYLDSIIKDYNSGSSANYDPSSELDASEVLFSIGAPTRTIIKELVCQLTDMATGACPQGRVNRLGAVLKVMRDPTFYVPGSG